jgi:hypothetical protein
MSYTYSSSTTQAHAHSPSASDGGPLSRTATLIGSQNVITVINEDGMILPLPVYTS